MSRTILDVVMHKASEDTLGIDAEVIIKMSIDLKDLTKLKYRNELDDDGNVVNRTVLEYGKWSYRETMIVDMTFEDFDRIYNALVNNVIV